MCSASYFKVWLERIKRFAARGNYLLSLIHFKISRLKQNVRLRWNISYENWELSNAKYTVCMQFTNIKIIIMKISILFYIYVLCKALLFQNNGPNIISEFFFYLLLSFKMHSKFMVFFCLEAFKSQISVIFLSVNGSVTMRMIICVAASQLQLCDSECSNSPCWPVFVYISCSCKI